MTKNELLQKLKKNISRSEHESLKNQDSNLIIGKYNRQIMLNMLSMTDVSEDIVDEQKVKELTGYLQKYLDKYMEQRDGHKWVILASLFNTFVLEVPMHPMEVTKIRTEYEEGVKVYYCSYKEEQEGSVCRFCVCRKASLTLL